jgi:hypothetical protein
MTEFWTRAQLREFVELEIRRMRKLYDDMPREIASQLPDEYRFRAERLLRIELERKFESMDVDEILEEMGRAGPGDEATVSVTTEPDAALGLTRCEASVPRRLACKGAAATTPGDGGEAA